MDMVQGGRSKMREWTAAPVGAASPCHCLSVRQAARYVTQLYDRHLAPLGLRATQYAVLAVLDRTGPLTVSQLALELVMDRTATGRALRPLERDGFILNGPGRDARARALSLTPAGLARLQAAQPAWSQAQSAFEAQYGPSEAEGLRLALARVIGRARGPSPGPSPAGVRPHTRSG